MPEPGVLPDCPHCGAPAEQSFIGRIDRLLIFDCVKCSKRFFMEEVPNHNLTNAMATQKRQYHKRRAS